MKIDSSAVCMQSTRAYSKSTSMQMRTTLRAPSYKEGSIGFYQGFKNNSLKSVNNPSRVHNTRLSEAMELRRKFIMRLIDFLTGRKGYADSQDHDGNIVDMREDGGNENPALGTVWTRVNETSFSVYESETTTFNSTGYAKTSDGRTISFNVELGMSREFQAVYTQYEEADYIITDPLVINIGNDTASVSDMKFLFDLDCDGEKEEISFVGAGSGFLAFDKNGDGEINDGSELFGTKSGNGFADLAAFDSDNNGWIDENDDIYDKLKVWTKDENGKDILMDLKRADVGAIYLGNVNTQFSLTDSNNYANAFIRSTGIFLKESGGIGTVNQLDLTS